MPDYATPGHPYSSQSIHVRSNPVYKSKDGRYEVTELESPRRSWNLPDEVKDSIPRAKTAPLPSGFKKIPPINKGKKLIPWNYHQRTPWIRDMHRWFTPDRSQGVWHHNEDFDKYRREALAFRTPSRSIYHIGNGLMPNYSGHVPGQLFRYGSTWATETTNARMVGLPRPHTSTSLFENRPIGA